MERVPAEQFPKRDRAGLGRFLEHCRARACERGDCVFASISLRVKYIDPLAVLESIFEPGAHHCYLERPEADEAVAAAEAVVSREFSGAARFRDAEAFARDVFERSILIGEPDLPFAGPHIFAGFAFSDEPQPHSPFAPATLFLPTWQVGRSGSVSVAVANARIDPDTDTEALAERVWRAHGKFGAFDYAAFSEAPDSGAAVQRGPHDEGAAFEAAVARALERIDRGAYQKIVLARTVDLQADKPLRPLALLNRLRAGYPSCFAFSFSNESHSSFIGASPERLARARQGRLCTEALAGSAPRGRTAREDARLAHELLASDKDRREQVLVLDSIHRRLQQAGLQPESPPEPRLLRLGNVQHLLTPVAADIPPGQTLLSLAGNLHPTPAVGGQPRQAALADLPHLENFERGLYAGLIGWLDWHGDGELVVAIRSALIQDTQARLYAGAGIVQGSLPAREKAETDLKLRALLDIIENDA